MRRSCAPSMRRAKAAEKRRSIDKLFEAAGSENEVSSTTSTDDYQWGSAQHKTQATKENADTFGDKLVFNVVWREISKKKHKTWDGDGTLEVQLTAQRAVFKDSSGKFMGCNSKYKIEELQEGHQMVVGGKEIELLEQITDRNEYFALRKMQVANRGWGDEEAEVAKSEPAVKKSKFSAFYQNNSILTNNAASTKAATRSTGDENICPTSVGSQSFAKKGKVIYNVVWRELTTKKHKTWNGDGILEVDLCLESAVLKDEKGNAMGSIEKIALNELTEGLQLVIEDKEIEVLDRLENTTRTQKVRKPVAMQSCNVFAARPKSTIAPEFILPAPTAVATNKNCNLQDVCVAPALAQHLRPHQREGVVVMYNCLMGFQHRDYFGCILADEMGLGKTLQCLTVAHTLLRTGPFGGARVLQRVLIVTPSSLTANWEHEINKWLKSERMYGFVVGGKHKLATYAQQHHVPFVIVSYESLLGHIAEFDRLKFDLLICDEGHRLKNQSTKIFAALRDLNITRRIILTGTPVQNDLQEFFALADFVNPGIFGSQQEFRRYYEQPLQQSQCPTATAEVKALAAERAQELNSIAGKFLLRRLQQLNRQYLPKKREYICFVQPSELQQFMLQKALDLYERRKESILKDLTPLQIITVLKKICNHPSLVARTKTPNLYTRNLERYLPDCAEMGPFDSAKLELVQHFLVTTAVERREKCVLVSNHAKTLNMLQGLCDFLNIKCLRLDGATPNAERNANVAQFNSPESSEDAALVFLLSAKAGGMGLNLIGATRLILFDNDWNPATDVQAMSRIWRDGQQSDVQIYRLVTAGCIEEKIFQRQVAKMSLGDCVLQASAINTADTMKFTAEELLDLFTLQQDFSTCQTHESLNCQCAGDGKNLQQPSTSNQCKQINELLQWQHYRPPFDVEFLQEACLHNASENLLYIFANQTDLN